MKKAIKERKSTLELSGTDLPELRDVHVDDELTVTLVLKATRITEGGYMYEFCDDEDCEECDPVRNKKKVSGSFQIQSAKFVDIKPAEGGDTTTGGTREARIATKYNELVKKGIKSADAMARAMKEK